MTDNKLPDNVVELHTTRSPEQSNQLPEQAQPEAPEANNEMVLELIQKNRRKGLDKLERKIDNLNDRTPLTDPDLENTIRNLTQGMQGTLTSLEAVNSLLDFAVNDLVACIQNVERSARGQWQVSAHLQTLLSLLEEKGVITDTEMRDMWAKVVEGTSAGAEEETTEEEAPVEEATPEVEEAPEEVTDAE